MQGSVGSTLQLSDPFCTVRDNRGKLEGISCFDPCSSMVLRNFFLQVDLLPTSLEGLRIVLFGSRKDDSLSDHYLS